MTSAEISPCPPTPAPTARRMQAVCFLLLVALPWLNPFAGGAMTPAIPLLVGWTCTALLFACFPALRWSTEAVLAGAALLLAAALGLVADTRWQMLALGLCVVALAASVGARMATWPQQLADAHASPLEADPIRRGVQLIAWSWLLAGLLNAAIGALQSIQHTAWLGVWVNHAPVGQVYGNLRQRNQYATLMSLALWALWYLWQTRAWGKAAVGTVLAWVLAAPLALMLALTMSRTGLVQLVMLAAALLWWAWRTPQLRPARWHVAAWLAMLLAVYAAGSLGIPHLRGGMDIMVRLEGGDSRACISRTVLWSNVWHLIQQRPLQGWGWGGLELAHYEAHYSGMRFCDMLDNAHNLPLHLAVELGMPVAIATCALTLWWLLRQRPWRDTAPSRHLMWGVLLMMATHSMLEYPLWYAPFQTALGLALGVLWATSATPRANASAQAPQRHLAPAAMRSAQRVLAAIWLAALAYASFDYVRVSQLYVDPPKRLQPFRAHTMQQAARTPLYRNAVDFARLTTSTPDAHNAAEQLALAQQVMHYSAEARVAIRRIESLHLLGRHDEANTHARHLAEVYPDAYQKWKKTKASAP